MKQFTKGNFQKRTYRNFFLLKPTSKVITIAEVKRFETHVLKIYLHLKGLKYIYKCQMKVTLRVGIGSGLQV